jgi:hypothetical protein
LTQDTPADLEQLEALSWPLSHVVLVLLVLLVLVLLLLLLRVLLLLLVLALLLVEPCLTGLA